MSHSIAALVLAAGKGTRMKSKKNKVLHLLMGQPILAHVLNAVRYLEPDPTVVVVGHQSDLVRKSIQDDGVVFVEQVRQLGTGNAVASARDVLSDFPGTVLILSGDVPLLSPQTMLDFLAAHRESAALLSVLTVELDHPGAYGRILRDDQGQLLGIVEARDCRPEELEIREINSGIYAVRAEPLFQAVSRLAPDNDQAEYYLTDIVSDFREQGLPVAAILCPDPEEVMGINNRIELARAGAVLKEKINTSWMAAGVTMIDPATNYIEAGVKLAPDVVLWPGVCLRGRTRIEEGVEIGPDCLVVDSVVGQEAEILKGSVLEGAKIPGGAKIGPLAVVGRE